MLRKILVPALLSTALVLPVVVAHADEEPRYSEWGSHAAETADTGSAQALAAELEALIDEAEKARAADPRFLEDLRAKIAEYATASAAAAVPRVALIQDDFSDGDITDNPTWTVISGDFGVDGELGLRTVVRMGPAEVEKSGATFDDLLGKGKDALDSGKTAFDDLISGKEDDDTAPAGPEPSEIVLSKAISNAFSLEMELSSRIATEGAQLEIDLFQGATRASGYRLIYLPGSDPGLQLARFGRRGITVIGEHDDDLNLEDGYGHKLVVTRAGDGMMVVTVDNTELIRVKSTAFNDPFDGISMVNAGGDFAVRQIAVYGAE
jgi:hypothetical protein